MSINQSEVNQRRESVVLLLNDKWLEETANPIFDKNKNIIGFVNIVSDVTEYKLYEEALIISESNLTSLINNSNESSWS